MSTPAPLIDRPTISANVETFVKPEQQVIVPPAETANVPDYDTPDPDFPRNPLWIIAIAGVCLFLAMAALIALG
jgi:hypothetical protein